MWTETQERSTLASRIARALAQAPRLGRGKVAGVAGALLMLASGCAGAPAPKADAEADARVCLKATRALVAKLDEAKEANSAVTWTTQDGRSTLCFDRAQAAKLVLDLGAPEPAAPAPAPLGFGPGGPPSEPQSVPVPPIDPSLQPAPDTGPVVPMPAVALPKGFQDSDLIPVQGSYARGGAQAPVTVVVFEDLQCPFSKRASATLDALVERYGDKVRVVSKHYPLAFHVDAELAAHAALAAGKQGKFWEYRATVYAAPRHLKRVHLETYAQRLGLDMDRFRADLDDDALGAVVKDDMALAQKVGVRGTPNFFVNGERISGAQPIEKFQEVIDAELAALPKAKPAHYAARVKANYAAPVAAARAPSGAMPPDDTEYKVPIQGSPVRGSKQALVTIVAFEDFQCPYCKKAQGALAQLQETFPDQVRLVYKHNPLPFHKDAEPAARAAYAADKQGKFWEYHALAYANPRALKTDDLEGYARQLGLNMARFTRDMRSPAAAKRVKEDQALAAKVNATGTPTYFINGRKLVGAQPFSAFETAVQGALDRAQPLTRKGLRGDRLYNAIQLKAFASFADAQKAFGGNDDGGGEEEVERVGPIEVGASPTLGPAKAPVTIVIASEFQCPFCARAAPTLEQVTKAYKGRVRLVFKHFPLEFHKDAPLAAEAALAAHAQGKFWPYHDLLFANQRELKRPDLERYAQQLGLDMARFNEDLDSGRFKAQVDEDAALLRKLGVTGTPNFFINGRKLTGAQPFAKFQEIIDAELKPKPKGKGKRKGR